MVANFNSATVAPNDGIAQWFPFFVNYYQAVHLIRNANTTGAVGAARAVGLIDGDYETFGNNIIKNDHVMTYMPLQNSQPYQEAYQNWKKELEYIINK